MTPPKERPEPWYRYEDRWIAREGSSETYDWAATEGAPMIELLRLEVEQLTPRTVRLFYRGRVKIVRRAENTNFAAPTPEIAWAQFLTRKRKQAWILGRSMNRLMRVRSLARNRPLDVMDGRVLASASTTVSPEEWSGQ